MKRSKTRVAILFGGKSAEHKISLLSAKNVIEALDKKQYHPVLVGISPRGEWLYNEEAPLILHAEDEHRIALNERSDRIVCIPQGEGRLFNLTKQTFIEQVDIFFPILHGPFGEDGTIQGLLQLADSPFVGAGVLGSAIGMDKEVMKKLLRQANLPIGDYCCIKHHQPRPAFSSVAERLGVPFFIKPANLGSSIGIRRVDTAPAYHEALDHAFSFDHKVLIEAFIQGREIECALLGNETPEVSVPGEISFTHTFYSYEAKYQDTQGYTLHIPAPIAEQQAKQIQHIAQAAFEALSCEGFARVDSFLTEDGKVFVNEINTIPGFTKISMYPKLWEASGIPYAELIDRLIQLAIQRHARDKKIKNSL